MIRLKVLHSIPSFILIVALFAGFHFAAAESNFSVEAEKKKEFFVSDTSTFNEISFGEQNRLAHLKLIQEGYQFTSENGTESTLHLLDKVVHYLLHNRDDEEKITELSTILSRPLGLYGSEQEEKTLFTQKMSVIHDWLKRSILGTSFVEWIMNKVSLIKMKENNAHMTHRHFESSFLKNLEDKIKKGEMSRETKKYYLRHVITEDMPTFLLQTINKEELQRLQLINLSEPEFGFLHVGLKFLRKFQTETYQIDSLNDIEDLGVFIVNRFLRDEVIDENELQDLLELPAKIYYLSTLSNKKPLPQKIWGTYYEEYLDYLINSNPFIQLMDPLNNWKNRSTLARQMLKANNISEEIFLEAYLNLGDSPEGNYPNGKGEVIQLPSIDHIFDEQNKNASGSFRELDKLMLFQLFNKIDKEDQKFIQTAEISKVEAKLIKNINFFTLSLLRAKDFNSEHTVKPPIYLKADNVDLLQCISTSEERVYAINTKNFELLRVDKNINKIIKIYNRSDLIDDRELYFIEKSHIKNKEESIEVLVNKLSEIHSERLYKTLGKIGYEPTFWQKFKDFLLNFVVPFYTCISELKNGNLEDAVLPCTIDIVALVPFVGHSIKIANRLFVASVEASVSALQRAARQATIYQILRQTGKNFFNNEILKVNKGVNLRLYSGLGRELLYAVDPGIGLLSFGGKQAVKAIKEARSLLRSKFPKLDMRLEKLSAKAEKELSVTTQLISDEILQTKQIVTLPYNSKEVAVVKIGTKKGKNVIARINEETNIIYGRKYLIDPKTGNIEFDSIPIRDTIWNVKTQGLNGGAVQAGQVWARWDQQTTSLTAQTRVKKVFRVDTRHPNDILNGAEGFRPRAGWYDYNLEMHLTISLNNGEHLGATSPFVSTTSSLQIARKYLSEVCAFTENLKTYGPSNANKIVNRDKVIGYVYSIRPGSNFYNVRESYMAARDVCHPDTARYKRLNDLIKYWGNLDEYAALDGFGPERIIGYAPVKASDDGVSQLEWVSNSLYNPELVLDQSASELYTQVSIQKPNDALNMAINLVQQEFLVNKIRAKTLILNNLESTKIEDLITTFNRNKQEYSNIITELYNRISYNVINS